MVSIIVASYNIKDYIDKMMESLVNQTYKDLEIIIVDDGSTDGTADKCDIWAQKDSRVRVIHKDNSGVAESRRIAVSQAQGSEIMLVDGDDYVAPNYVEKLYKALKSTDSDMAISSFYFVYPKKKIMKEPIVRYIKGKTITSQDALYIYFARKLSGYYSRVLWNKIYKREIVLESDFFGERHHSDSYQLPNFFQRSKRIAVIPDCLYYYVQRDSSLIHTNRKERYEMLYRTDLWRLDFFSKYGGKEAELTNILYMYTFFNKERPEFAKVSDWDLKKRYIKAFFTKKYTSDLSKNHRKELWAALFSFRFYYNYIKKHKVENLKKIKWNPDPNKKPKAKK